MSGHACDTWDMVRSYIDMISLQWRHNERDGVSNQQPHDCLLNPSFWRRSKKTSKLRVTGLCMGNSPVTVNSPHKGPVTRKMFPFDDVIMWQSFIVTKQNSWQYGIFWSAIGLSDIYWESYFHLHIYNYHYHYHISGSNKTFGSHGAINKDPNLFPTYSPTWFL